MIQRIEEEKMTPEQFVFWLQGFMETADPKTLNKKQTQIVKDHLTLVFKKVTPVNPGTLFLGNNMPSQNFTKPYNPMPYFDPNTTTLC